MKDNKSSLLLVVSLLLLSLSLVLLSIWGYQFFKGNNQKDGIASENAPSAAINNNTRDSLMDVYAKTISKLDVRIVAAKNTADSLMGNVNDKITEINSLKDEIKLLLKNKVSKESLNTAREKINKLQVKIDELQQKNLSIENENKQLKALLQQYDKGAVAPAATVNPAGANKIPQSSTTGNKPVLAQSFVLTGIRVNAFAVKDDKETETLKATEANKINGSFTIKSGTANDNVDIYVTVLQPNGKVVQNSDWEVGTFETPEGRKIYSHKIHTRFDAGEEKLLHFSLAGENFEKGNYTVLIYQNGTVIGKLVMSLS